MYQKAEDKLVRNLNKIYKKTGKVDITLGQAKKYGLDVALAQFERDVYRITEKEIKKLDKQMKDKYLNTYVDITGVKRKPQKKAKEIIHYPWSGMNHTTRMNRNAYAYIDAIRNQMESQLRKTGSLLHTLLGMRALFDQYSKRQRVLCETELWYMRQRATLDGYKFNGVKLVKYVTMDDNRVCPECKALEEYNEGIYTIEDAPILPRHPRCRCELIQYNN